MIEEKTENSEEEEFYIYSGESYSDEEVESKINNSIHLIFFFGITSLFIHSPFFSS